MSTEFYLVAVSLVTVIATARVIRLLNIDKFPPIRWARDRYEAKTDGTDWQLLTLCNYCMGVWVAGLVVGLGLAADVYTLSPEPTWGFKAWWITAAILAVAYVAAIFVTVDQDPEDA